MSADRRVVVVTGASQGLGEAFVKAYRQREDADYVTGEIAYVDGGLAAGH